MVGGRAEAELAGGVRDLGSSCEAAERDDPGMPRSGDAEVGVACGIEPSNSSARKSVLYVRLACSAIGIKSACSRHETTGGQLTPLEIQLAVRGPL